jgi:hypothetical protein
VFTVELNAVTRRRGWRSPVVTRYLSSRQPDLPACYHWLDRHTRCLYTADTRATLTITSDAGQVVIRTDWTKRGNGRA